MRFPPFPHQRDSLAKHWHLPSWAHFWEQGTGKTKQTIDEACALRNAGKIQRVLVVAPNGVHRNWGTDELPTHMWESVCHTTYIYNSSSAGSKTAERELNQFLNTGLNSFRWLLMTYDAILTKRGAELAHSFCSSEPTMLVLDESIRIKNPKAQRTRAIVGETRRRAGRIHMVPGLSDLCPYRRILNGTPISQGPLDVYSQILALDRYFWDRHGMSSFAAFRARYALTRQMTSPGGRMFEIVVGYRNLVELQGIVAKISDRVLKEEVLRDLPPKLYKKIYFELSENQHKLYKSLRDEFVAEFGADIITTPDVLTRLTRLHQITCGYIGVLDENSIEYRAQAIPGPNPRLSALRDILQDVSGKAIVYARFTADVDAICRMMEDEKLGHQRHDGGCSATDRALAIESFKEDDGVRFLVGTEATMGEGLTLTQAKTVIYYSNQYSLKSRLQSEDRAHRIGQQNAVLYIDLCAQGTIDEAIVRALREKRDVAQLIQGDPVRTWI